MPTLEADYELKQAAADHQYVEAWKDAPQSFKDKAQKNGIDVAPEDRDGMAMPFNENLSTASYTPDMAGSIDTHIDYLIEEFGVQHEKIIRAIADRLAEPMKREIELNRALMLGRMMGFMIKSDKCDMLAKCHQMLHSIPRMAAACGYNSMRESARKCGVSVEWIRKGRDKFCETLGIPIPAIGQKTESAKLKYKHNALTNHWKKKKFTTKDLKKVN